MNRDGILFQYSLATEGGMNSCGASPREEQDNRLCVGCYYILDHSLSGLFILKREDFEKWNWLYLLITDKHIIFMKWRILSQQQQDLVLFILGRLRELLAQLHLTIHQQLVMRLRRYKMDNEKFITKCKKLVADYANENFDKTDQTQITMDKVFAVWSCKTLQNNKALLSTTVSDGMYYELTYNGDKSEIYFDAYKKWENKAIKV